MGKILTVQIRPIVCLSEVKFAWIEVGDEQRSILHKSCHLLAMPLLVYCFH